METRISYPKSYSFLKEFKNNIQQEEFQTTRCKLRLNVSQTTFCLQISVILIHSWHLAHNTQSCPTLCDPLYCSLPGFSVQGILQARNLNRLPFPSPENHPDPEIDPRSPALQADSLPFELQGSPNSFLLNIFFPRVLCYLQTLREFPYCKAQPGLCKRFVLLAVEF